MSNSVISQSPNPAGRYPNTYSHQDLIEQSGPKPRGKYTWDNCLPTRWASSGKGSGHPHVVYHSICSFLSHP